MRRLLIFAALVVIGSTASAQTSNTNCQFVFNQMQCQTTTYQPPQPTPVPLITVPPPPVDVGKSVWEGFERGRKMREDAERARLEREVLQAQIDAARAQQESAQQLHPTIQTALVSLSCTFDRLGPPLKQLTVTLDENSSSAQVTHAGYTYTAEAAFTPENVSWKVGDYATTISRLNLSVVFGTDDVRDSGTCQIAQRQF